MIYIFHGDNQVDSRQAFHQLLSNFKDSEVFKVDAKSIDLNQINNFLQSGSLFPGSKTICFNNFFSVAKSNFDKIVKLIKSDSCDIVIWQDKQLSATQLKTFPNAKVSCFRTNNQIFSCINSIKPKNIDQFTKLYDEVINQDLFDLFLYLIKANFRKQLISNSKFDITVLKKIYLQVIELEFQYKTGQLPLPKDIALLRTLTPLLR